MKERFSSPKIRESNTAAPKTIIILGPTAAGKSEFALKLTQEQNGEIISADSMQVYRGMNIGTAKLSLEERQGIPHHLIDIRNPDEEWTVSDFIEQVNRLTSQLANPIIVGGTGLYLWSLLEGYSFPGAASDPDLRKRLEKSPQADLFAQLLKVDPQAAQKINPNDKKRLVRALEVYELTGKPISELQKERQYSPHLSVGNRNVVIGLNVPRDELYSRINQRVDNMIARGLIEEVKWLLAKGYPKNLKSFQALGYKEAIEYIEGHWALDKMKEELKKRTRHFARRQLTWFRRFKNVQWFEPPVDFKEILSYIKVI